MERNLRVLIYSLVILFSIAEFLYADVKRPDTIKEVFFTGTNHELEVYKIYGRKDGPTMLLKELIFFCLYRLHCQMNIPV